MARKTQVAGAKAMIRQLERERKLVGARRDALRDMVDEYEALFESCDRADDRLQSAIDALSELA